MLNPLSNFTLAINNTSATRVNRNVLHTPTGESLNSAGASSASGVIVSSLAGQLSEAAVRADIREATLTRHAVRRVVPAACQPRWHTGPPPARTLPVTCSSTT
ncbi:hypothetical protein IFR09_21420 [Pseudomonas syringae]|nr:hypothetical protein [Pseudomonas syringae]MBD8573797.1 hypothetical protein [Pseudomonas syringae]MBD8792646.1 hypothetical protein [Pseudomonas syringae]MBD8802944.1 hypothetical protein [Pseudomonas syringae]MBD8813726.1 hypothetical protein [Pseudomonas syringae]